MYKCTLNGIELFQLEKEDFEAGRLDMMVRLNEEKVSKNKQADQTGDKDKSN